MPVLVSEEAREELARRQRELAASFGRVPPYSEVLDRVLGLREGE